MTDRFDFIEDDRLKKRKRDADDSAVRYPQMAMYDFTATGPRTGNVTDQALYNAAKNFVTRGEELSSVLIRISWILLRLAIGIAFIYLFLRGREFGCFRGGITFY